MLSLSWVGDGVHRCKQFRGSHPHRRILVAGHVENEEPIGIGVISGQGRDVSTSFLSDRAAQIIDDHVVILRTQVFPGDLPEFIKTAVGRMVNLCLHGMDFEKPADLVQCHALPHEHGLRKHLLGLFVENVVLGKGVERLELGRGRRFDPDGVEDHDNRCDATIGAVLLCHELNAQRPVGLPGLAVEQQVFSLFAGKADEVLGQWKRLCERSSGQQIEPEDSNSQNRNDGAHEVGPADR